MQKEFEFLGGTEALIDTTSENFDSLFVISGTGRVNLVKSENLEIDALDEAVPELRDERRQFSATVGPIGFDEFSTGGEVGLVSFEEVTGLPASTLSEGTPIPAGQSPGPIEVELNTDYLEQITVKEGSVELEVENRLGIDIEQLDLQLLSDGAEVGNTATFTQFDHNTVRAATISFSEGEVLRDLSVSVEISWQSQTMKADAGDIIVQEVRGRDLKASSIQARVPSQTFTRAEDINLDTSEFEFRNDQHYVQLESGNLSVQNLVNRLDLGLDSLQLSFGGIVLPDQSGNYNPADSLVVDLTGNGTIERNNRLAEPVDIDLSGARIRANGNRLDYYIVASTIDTRNTRDTIRTVEAEDSISAEVALENLKLDRARGFIHPQLVSVTEDDEGNGTDKLDVFNDREAEKIEIDGLKELSKQLDGLEFQQSRMTIRYQSNIGIGSRIYAALVGIGGSGDRIYLRGKPGSSKYVEEPDTVSGFLAEGAPLDHRNLIQFGVDAAEGFESGTVSFTPDNSNINEFLDNLPTQIRFVGKGLINPGQEDGMLISPVRFNPEIEVNVPLSLATPDNPATYSDTVETDTDFLPDRQSDSQVERASLTIDYQNRLPFSFNLHLTFLDEQMLPLFTMPLDTQDPLIMQPAATGSDGYVTDVNEGTMEIEFNESQIDSLREAEHMILQNRFNTTNNETVNVRASDALSIRIGAKISTQTEVN